MNNSIFNPESVNRTRYLSCKCRRPPLLPPSLPSPLPSHAESVVHQTSCSLASVHSVFTPRSRFRRCTCIRIGDTCTRPLHRAHTHIFTQRWWGGKGARWVNRVSAKRWVAISEFLVGKHRHDGPWSRLRAQSCIGDSIGEGGGEKRGEEIVSRRLFKRAPRIFREPSYSTTKRLPICIHTRFSASRHLSASSVHSPLMNAFCFGLNKWIGLRERFLDSENLFRVNF